MKWPTYPLSKIAVDLQPGFARQPGAGDTSLPQLRTNNVSPDGRIDLALVKEVPASKKECERYSLQKGDVLFNNTNSVDLVGKTALFDLDGGPFLFSNHMTRVRINHEVADPRFIARCLFWTWKIGGFRMMVTRWVNQAAINKTMLGSVIVQLPALSEQRRIVEILDQADALRKKHAEADAITARILSALFFKMFGNPATNSMNWPMAPLSSFFTSDRHGPRCGPFGSALKKHEYVDRGIPVWGIENVLPNRFAEDGSLFITEDKYHKLIAYSVVHGDILISRAGTVGRMCVATPTVVRSIIGTNLIRLAFDLEALDPEYFSAMFTCFPQISVRFRAASDAGAYSFMNTSILKSLQIPVPPAKLQRRFAHYVSAVRALEQSHAATREQIRRLFESLLHRAFTGALTAKWNEAHMKELLAEMEFQAECLS